MTSNSKLYFSDRFSPGLIKDYTLVIQIRNTDFSFAVVDKSTLLACGKYYPLSELTTPELLSAILAPNNYQQVIIGLVPEVFNLVPKALYQEDRAADFMRVLDVQPLEKAYSQTLDEANLVLFKDGNHIVPSLMARYASYKVVFGYTGWLKALAAKQPTSANFYVDVQLNTVHFAYFKDSKLRFYNSFNYTGADELTYFTALTTTELNLKAVSTRLVISGDVVYGDQSIKALAEFFPNIDINEQKPVEQLPEHIASQNLLSLTALMLCV